MPNFCVILAAAGRSERFRDKASADASFHTKKPFVNCNGKPVWLHSAELFRRRRDISQIILVVSPEDESEIRNHFSHSIDRLKVTVVAGGDRRSDSVRNAVLAADRSVEFIAIHDAARPCIDDELVDRVFDAAVCCGMAIPTTAVHSTVKRSVDHMTVSQTVDRAELYLSQTPQVFDIKKLREMFLHASDLTFTDESQLAEMLGYAVAMSRGSAMNIKITTAQDLQLAALFLTAKLIDH